MVVLSMLVTGSLAMVNYSELFNAWKVEHGKVYTDGPAEAKAFDAFYANELKITEHNSKGLSYKLGHNEFSDLTAEEFFSARLGFKPSLIRPRLGYSGPKLPADVPGLVDWRAKGAVTPIKNQGQCGSCWSFSATGSIEGAYAIATGKLTSLSEEDLVQCDQVDQGCQGGLMDNAFKFVMNNGIAAEDAYRYISGTGIRGMCNATKEAAAVVSIGGYEDVPSGNETALMAAVAQQPVSIAIEADKSAFQLYKSGVLDSPFCGTQLDHGVLAVGYGTSTLGKDYWIVKNSWGSTWGEDGYIRMVRGKNMCGIAQQPSYPTGAKTATKVKATVA